MSHMNGTDFALFLISHINTSINSRGQFKLSVSPKSSQLIVDVVTFGYDFNMVDLNSPPDKWPFAL